MKITVEMIFPEQVVDDAAYGIPTSEIAHRAMELWIDNTEKNNIPISDMKVTVARSENDSIELRYEPKKRRP